ncbi:MAG TPA: PDZ domain-containing protein, partial [Acidobacteria bacterium]|nr:PDZ domain-containing protein [Acidobacteriota bacterium]
MKSSLLAPRRIALVAAVALVFLLVGARAAAPRAGSRMAAFTEILSLIESRHVPEAKPKSVIYAGIHGMLGTLDPHTNFLDDEAFRDMRDEQRGSFYGLGIVISKRGRNQPLRVVSPIADTPAARLGIRAGDVITHIRDRRADVDLDTMGLTIQESVKHLRGPRGTEVEITINRPGVDKPLVFSVVRDAIRTPAVNLAMMLRPEVGYV